jgi:hypothetical protein
MYSRKKCEDQLQSHCGLFSIRKKTSINYRGRDYNIENTEDSLYAGNLAIIREEKMSEKWKRIPI